MQIFSDIRSQVQNLIERSDAGMSTKINGFINAGWRYVAGYRPWMALLRSSSFPAVAGLDYFISGQEVDQVIHLSQRETPIVLALQKYYNLLQRNVDVITTGGFPSTATPAGEIGVKAALPSDGTLIAVSSNAADTTQILRVQGFNIALLPVSESIALNGTTNAVSTLSYSSKEGYEPKFSKDSDTAGVISITRAGTAIAELAPAERDAKYKKWKVFPAFSTALTMYITFKRRIRLLSADSDTPDLDCTNALVMFSYARCLQEKRQTSKARDAFGVVDANGDYPPGTFMAELNSLIANEPQFSENFTDQLIPIINRNSIDMQNGQGGYQLWPSS